MIAPVIFIEVDGVSGILFENYGSHQRLGKSCLSALNNVPISLYLRVGIVYLKI